MKICVGIPHFVVVVFLNSIYARTVENSSSTQNPFAIEIADNAITFIATTSGLFYGGRVHKLKQFHGLPEWIKHKAPRNDNAANFFVQEPNGALEGTIKFLKEQKAMANYKSLNEAALIVGKGVLGKGIVFSNLRPLEKIPNKLVHTRIYVGFPNGQVFTGILTRDRIRKLPHFKL